MTTATFTPGFFEYASKQGDVSLHYVEAGNGPLVIFYHGFPLFWYAFHHQMKALQAQFRVVAVDGPGVNLSSKPKHLDPYRLSNLSEQLDQLARHLTGDEPFSLVGHDWGGALAWAYAQRYEHRLTKVVSINAPPANQLLALLETNTEQQQRSAYMYSMRDGELNKLMTENNGERTWMNAYAKLRDLPHYTKEDDEIFRKGLAQPGAIDGAINWYRANIPDLERIGPNDFWPSRSASTNTPSMLIWGDDDDTFVNEFIDDLPNYAHDLTVKRIPGAGHSPMLEVPAVVNTLLLEFLTS